MMRALHHSSMSGLHALSGSMPYRRLSAAVEAFVKFFSFGQLRIRLIMLVLIAVVPFASLLFYSDSEQKRQSVAAIEQNVLTMAEFAAQAEALMLDGSREMLASLAVTLGDRWTAPAECNAFLAKLLGRDRRYQNLGAVSDEGKLVCSAAPFNHEFDAREQSWFRQAASSRELSLGELHLRNRSAIPSEVIAFPVEGNGGRFIGVVFAVLEPHWLNRFNLKMKRSLPNGSAVAQIDENGDVLAHHPDSMTWNAWPADRGALIGALRSMSDGMIMLTAPDGQPWFYAFSALRSAVQTRKAISSWLFPRQPSLRKPTGYWLTTSPCWRARPC